MDMLSNKSSFHHLMDRNPFRSSSTGHLINHHISLPNNRHNYDAAPILIESKNHANLNLSNDHLKTSNFSNFMNYRTMIDNQHRERSKYFDVYHPIKESPRSEIDSRSLSGSQSTSHPISNNNTQSILMTKTDQTDCVNFVANSQPSVSTNCSSKQVSDEIKNFNLDAPPPRFDIDKVSYVNTFKRAQSIVDAIKQRSKVIALNCDSDCCLQNGIDLLEVAVINNESLDHPEIYVFDIYLEPSIIELFKPIFADSRIVKVMFDARFDLRILSRKYDVTEFTALFDIQLAFRVLLAKLTNRPFDQIKREKLLYVSWRCNGPMANFEKKQLADTFYFSNRKFWRMRPINFEVMYNAAYDVFVMAPQLFTNLLVIMERTFDLEHRQEFVRRSNELIVRNLVPRKFSFFRNKSQYLNEIHRQFDLLVQSDTQHRNKQIIKWQQQLIRGYENEDVFGTDHGETHDLLNNRIDEIDMDSYMNFTNSGQKLMFSGNNYMFASGENNRDLFASGETNRDLFSNGETNRDLFASQHSADSTSDESGTQSNELAFAYEDSESNCALMSCYCENCKLPIKNDGLGELLHNLERTSITKGVQNGKLEEILFANPRYCRCVQSNLWSADEDDKCMNLLVDQIIDLVECKEDYMELEE